MMSSTFLESAVSYLYAILTIFKVVQFVTFAIQKGGKLLPQESATEDEDDPTEKDRTKKKNRVEYTPGLQVVLTTVDWVMGEKKSVTKIPRKVFREITDPWLANYNQLVQARPPKTFTSLRQAKQSMVQEFTQDPWSGLYGDNVATGVACFIKFPGGLVSTLALLQTRLVSTLFLIREKLVFQGNMKSLFLKGAAAITITEVYVVSCKEQITFEEALHKYPWLAGVLSHQPMQHMIGRSVCPMYQRQVNFQKDVMNFDYEIWDPPKSGLAVMQQVRSPAALWYVYEELMLPCVLVAAAIFGWIIHANGGNLPSRLLTNLLVHYAVRLFVDFAMGTKYHLRYLLYP